jgi:hypothetical protein
MAGFIIRRDDRNKGAISVPVSSIVVTVGDLLELVDGAANWTLCTTASTCSTRKAIAIQTVANTASEVAAIILDGNELVEATTDNTASANHNGDSMILGTATTGAMTINNTGTTVGSTETEQQFVQFKVKGDNSVLGFIQVGNGVLMSAST